MTKRFVTRKIAVIITTSLLMASMACTSYSEPNIPIEETVLKEDTSDEIKPEEESTDSDPDETEIVTYDKDKVELYDPYEHYYEDIVIDYAPTDDDYVYDPEVLLDKLEDILLSAGYEINTKYVPGKDPEEQPAALASARISSVYTEDGANKSSVIVDIFDFNTLEEANAFFENYATAYQCEDKLDTSRTSADYYRTYSNICIEDGTTGSKGEYFISQKDKEVYILSLAFMTPPRFSKDAVEPEIILDLDTAEDVLKALEVPYTMVK